MGKVARFLKRPSGMTVDELRDMWSRAPGLVSWATDESYGKRQPLFDGVQEVSSDDDGGDVPPGVALTVAVRDEVVVKDGPVPVDALRFIGFATIPPQWEREAYHAHWSGVHGPLAARNPHLLRYVQNHTGDDVALGDGRRIAGYATAWFAGTDGLRASAASVEYAAVVEDERTFIEGTPAFFVVR
ncbi:MAG: EthD family reductase [Actinobacteria bacterium]|nr:EthD family reductase [Actinomycetota bacterium]